MDYYNRKGYHSIILQGVCNDKAIFTDVFIGMPGRVHDARVFRRRPLYEKLIGDRPLLAAQQHLLGDSAYPLMASLLKPYRDNGHLSRQQVKYNQTLAAQRQAIERAFGLLKGRWRRLKYLDMSLDNQIPQTILATCILHNFILLHNENDLQFNINNDDDNITDDEFNYAPDEAEEPQNNATLKRNYISTLL